MVILYTFEGFSVEKLDKWGNITTSIPPEPWGHYFDDPAIREGAKGTEIHAWADKIEAEVMGLSHEDSFYDRSVLRYVEGVSWQSCLCPIPEKIP